MSKIASEATLGEGRDIDADVLTPFQDGLHESRRSFSEALKKGFERKCDIFHY